MIPFDSVDHDTIARRDISLEKLAALKPAYDHSGQGTLTAVNSTPNTDGAAAIWVANGEGLKRLGDPPAVNLVDRQVQAMDYREEGILMAPTRGIPRLLARSQGRITALGQKQPFDRLLTGQRLE